MIPFDITYSTHTSCNAGRRTSSSVDFNAGGVHIGWMHPFESAAQQKVVEYAREAGHKTSGSKHHDSWRIECADAACLHLWGTTVWDEITRAVMIEKPVHYAPSNPGYIVREGKLLEFYHSRCRDRTWTRALRLKECHAGAREFLLAGVNGTVREVGFLLVRDVILPRAAPRVRVEWRCEACGRRGFRESFRERSVPGLAGSTGLDCPLCPEREIGALATLMSGTPCGQVVPCGSAVLLPSW